MGVPGPVRAFRDRYAVPFGGISYDLAPRVVGIRLDDLQRVPELAGRDVLVSADRSAPTALARRPAFTVVGIAPSMRNAREVSQEGGLVFSSFDLDDPASGRLLAALHWGDTVYLNAALGRLPDPELRRPGAAS